MLLSEGKAGTAVIIGVQAIENDCAKVRAGGGAVSTETFDRDPSNRAIVVPVVLAKVPGPRRFGLINDDFDDDFSFARPTPTTIKAVPRPAVTLEEGETPLFSFSAPSPHHYRLGAFEITSITTPGRLGGESRLNLSTHAVLDSAPAEKADFYRSESVASPPVAPLLNDEVDTGKKTGVFSCFLSPCSLYPLLR